MYIFYMNKDVKPCFPFTILVVCFVTMPHKQYSLKSCIFKIHKKINKHSHLNFINAQFTIKTLYKTVKARNLSAP